MGKVWTGLGMFKGALRGKGRVNTLIIDVITDFNYMQVFFKYKYSVKSTQKVPYIK